MTRRKLLQKDLAAALGISAPMVTRYKKRGMPTNSIAAARRWRETDLDPMRVHAAAHQVRENILESPVSSTSSILNIVYRLGALAEKDFDAWGHDLREALRELNRQVPATVRADWPLLPLAVWEQLTADFRRKLRTAENANSDGDADHGPEAMGNSPMSDDDADDVGEFWFQVAIGAVRVNERGENAFGGEAV